MRNTDTWKRLLVAVVVALTGAVTAAPVAAQECVVLLPLFQQGKGDAAIAAITGLPRNAVSACRRELRRPISVSPAGAPPVGAAGPPPVNAPGPPPVGAAGAPPVGRDINRLP
jgi:hypothetical protein